jgi:hypothetical protein
VFRVAGLTGVLLDDKPEPVELEPGTDSVGLLPASDASEGFLFQENISVPGIFHPLLQPVWVPATTATTSTSRDQFAIVLRMANNSL